MVALKNGAAGDLELIDRFIATYNLIDRHLRQTLGLDVSRPFSALLSGAAERRLLMPRDVQTLRTAGDLRNILTHDRTSADGYQAVPTAAFVGAVERIHADLSRPALAVPTFKRHVETVSHNDTLAKVLRQIHKRDYSQFPVYDDSGFRGLLTENGITRWLAEHLTSELSLVDLEEVSVSKVLRKEEARRTNWRFASRKTTVPEIQAWFAGEELLEAVLITDGGKVTEKLLGIATRWDLIHLGGARQIRPPRSGSA